MIGRVRATDVSRVTAVNGFIRHVVTEKIAFGLLTGSSPRFMLGMCRVCGASSERESKMKLTESAITESGESGRLTFDTGTKIYWTVDAPYYVHHTDGRKTEEWPYGRFENPDGVSPETRWLEDHEGDEAEFERRPATADETIEIHKAVGYLDEEGNKVNQKWIERDEDDDPQCVCGVYRSEHSMMGCGNFQTGTEWESEKEFIAGLDDDEFDRIYHPEG